LFFFVVVVDLVGKLSQAFEKVGSKMGSWTVFRDRDPDASAAGLFAGLLGTFGGIAQAWQ
jgi:hypothetical protein